MKTVQFAGRAQVDAMLARFFAVAGSRVREHCQIKYGGIAIGCVANLTWGKFPRRVLLRIDDDGNVQWFGIDELRARHTKFDRLMKTTHMLGAATCRTCGGPRHPNSASQCRACYQAKLKLPKTERPTA